MASDPFNLVVVLDRQVTCRLSVYMPSSLLGTRWTWLPAPDTASSRHVRYGCSGFKSW